MGQQQLLLVILVTIIVGIATVVAINTFGSAADQANIDAVNNDVAALASAAQGFYMRPAMLGGGGRTFTELTFQGLAFPYNISDADNLIVENENGRYQISARAAGHFTIIATPASSEGYVAGTAPSTIGSGGVPFNTGVAPNNFRLNATGAEVAGEETAE
jgi:Tfp pilus assembly protein PilE